MAGQEFYVVPEDVFRLGSSTDAKLAHIRARDVDTILLNGIEVVIANGKGISVFDKEGIARSPMTGWVWRLSPNTRLPAGLKLVNDRPHHFCIAPVHNMPVDKYKGLLMELALSATRVFKKEGRLA